MYSKKNPEAPSQQPVSVLVLEDHQMQRMGLKVMLSRQGYEALTAKSVDDAIQILEEEKPDIALLDINISEDEDGGIKVGKHIQTQRKIPIIYLTGYQDKYDKAKLTNPNAFLDKDEGIANEKLILRSLDLAIHNFYGGQEDLGNIRIGRNFLLIKEEGVWEKVPIDQITRFNARNNDTAVFLNFTRDTKIPKDFFLVSTMPFKSLKDHLPVHRFEQTHRSHIVNLSHIQAFNSKQVVFESGEMIPLSNSYRNSFEAAYNRFHS